MRRFLAKIGAVSLQRGRLGKKELAAIQPFIRRGFAELMPCDVYSADGHTLDAEVLHPAHGRPFRPEVTSVIDIATRKLVGWSASLAESSLAVLEALTNAVQTNGIPNILYVDNGAGYKNAMMRDEASGLMGRLGTQMIHSLPYNSQARGVIERLQRTVWVRGAKTLPTYIGADMDREASHHVHKITRQAVRRGKAVPLMMSWPDFVAWCQAQVDAYNDRPHRSLPKITGDDGAPRHMTPNEAWARKVAEGAVIHTTRTEDEHWLFRPQEFRVVRRAEIQLLNNIYFARALEEWHGQTVRVAYDIHDGERVWIYDDAGRYICTAEANANRRAYLPQSLIERQADKRAAGRYICTAEANANRRAYLPQSLIERQADKRAAGRERRLRDRLDEVRAERDGQRVIEVDTTIDLGALKIDAAELAARGAAAMARLSADAEAAETAAPAATAAPAEGSAWQVPPDPQDRYALYLRLSARDDPPAEAARWLQTYPTSNEYRALRRANTTNRSTL